MVREDFSLVRDVFEKELSQNPAGISSQIVVYQHGEKVVDLHASAPDTPANSATTSYLTFSVSKGLTTIAILKLIDDGLIELDAPICQYWQEFGRNGKETATIRHALTHQAGIPAPHLYFQIPLWLSWDLVTRRVASYRAEYPPGEITAYHLVNFGFILGEVVRRVSGLKIDEYLQKHFFDPMSLQTIRMRIPAKLEIKSPRLVSMHPNVRRTAWLFNQHLIRRSLIPAAGLHSNAGDLAVLYQMLIDGGIYQGKRYLSSEIIALASSSQYDGYDAYVNSNMNWGLGFIIGGGKKYDLENDTNAMGFGSSDTTFGSFGMGTCMVWVDPPAGLVTAYTTNGMAANEDANKRWAHLSNAVWRCVCDKAQQITQA